MIKHNKKAEQPQPNCPHCGGMHLGQRFDNCTYVNILADPGSSDEQKRNAQGWLNNWNTGRTNKNLKPTSKVVTHFDFYSP